MNVCYTLGVNVRLGIQEGPAVAKESAERLAAFAVKQNRTLADLDTVRRAQSTADAAEYERLKLQEEILLHMLSEIRHHIERLEEELKTTVSGS